MKTGLSKLFHQIRENKRKAVASRNAPDDERGPSARRAESLRGVLIHDVTGRSDTQNTLGEDEFVVLGENEHFHVRAFHAQCLNQIDGVAAFQAKIENDKIGLELSAQSFGVGRVIGGSSAIEIVLATDQLLEAIPQQWVIIHDGDFRVTDMWRGRLHQGSAIVAICGTRQVITVPAPSRDSIWREPLTQGAR